MISSDYRMLLQLYKRTKNKLRRQRQDTLVLRGILHGSRAWIGPQIVQFDVTNRCNNNCLCCWNNSPLLGEPSEARREEKEYELPFDLIKRTIAELREMGTKILFFAGGGEPFMHPQIMEILKYAKESNMRIIMNTNFTLIDKKRAEEIVDLKVDFIHVSLLAGTAETYALIHPNKTTETFYQIKEILQYIAYLKQERNQNSPVPLPHIDLYYVIFNTNYRDIDSMVNLGIEVKANSLEFTPIDIIPGKTDILLLNDMQKKEVIRDIKIQNRKLEKLNRQQGVMIIFIEQYSSFINRLSAEGAVKGEYEVNTLVNWPCYVGWAFLRILANGNVIPCLKAHRISVGNIYEQSIKDIWNSPEQQLFRKESFKLDRNSLYFRMIGNNPDAQFGCLNSCDNIQINIDMHKKYGGILSKYGKVE